jgi:hypothetical protein
MENAGRSVAEVSKTAHQPPRKGDPMRGHEIGTLFEKELDRAYGRGFRRCLESLLKNPPARILIATCTADDQLREMNRAYVAKLSPEALEGFNSLDLEGGKNGRG